MSGISTVAKLKRKMRNMFRSQDEPSDKTEKSKNKKKSKSKSKELSVPYRPTIQSITAAGIMTYWKKPEDAGGYEIYRSYDANETGELAKVIDDKLLGIWLDTEFDPSYREIFYKVRSFVKKPDGSIRYSDFSEQFSAKFRPQLVLERDITYMHSGSRRRLRAFYGWGEAEDAVWTSSDDSVAVVDEEGFIRGISKGECELTCSSPSLGMEATSKVVVDRSAPEPLTEIRSRYQQDGGTGIWHKTEPSSEESAVIMMVGDMMCGKGQIENQYSEEEGWNFNDSFDYIREITQEADFSIGNLETLLDPGWPYMTDEWFIDNISNCNAPPRYLDAVRYGGFDGVIMANNHSCDGGVPAILATLDQVDRYQLVRTGAFRDKTERRYSIVDINGIKVGFLAYMSPKTGYKGKDRNWTDEEKAVILNNYKKEIAAKDIKECRDAGAEYVIVYMHWGEKNYKKPTEHQIREAGEVAEAGADYIVGSNPHVLEKYEEIKTSDGRTVPCFYSIGNFHARMNQIVGNRDSVIVKVRLGRNADGKVCLNENTYIPCSTYSKIEDSYLVPVSVSTMYHGDLKRHKREEKYNRIKKIIGDSISVCDEEKS